MIRYHLRCAEGHAFESWFADAAAFDALQARGMVTCAECGSGQVDKALMAPRVRSARGAAKPEVPTPVATGSAPQGGSVALNVSPMEKAVADLRAKIEANSTYVGKGFAAEARAMHRGEKTEAPIWGEATREEAKSLHEEGIAALPLPFGPRSKSN